MHAGIKPGLERISHLCSSIDDPQKRINVIHVAGTNGKGSTSSMLAAILQEAGYRVGLYTSPHITSFNERIRVNGTMMTDGDIERLLSPLLDAAKSIDATFFEITTALAFAYFAEKRVDVAIIEAGIGGRLDATNVVSPIASIITSIDYDHTDYLGTTLSSIAAEKAGIIKEGAPAIIGPLKGAHDSHTVDELRSVFQNRADAVGTRIIFTDDVVKVDVDRIHPDLTMSVSTINGEFLNYFEVGVAGRHQARNIATVLAAIPQLRDVMFVEHEHISHGLRKVRELTGLSGRINCLRTNPPVIIDVSHNPAGIAALRTTLRDAGFEDGSFHVVFGAMQDKDILGMLTELKPLASTLHLCAPDYHRATPVQALQQLADQVGFPRITAHALVTDAVKLAMRRGPTIICGSFFVASEAMPVIGGNTKAT